MNTQEITSRDWFGKVSAAFVLGFLLMLAVTSIFGLLTFRGHYFMLPQVQLTLWLASPIWCLILGGCFLFRSTARAWGWLAAANLLAWPLYAGLRLMGH